METDQHKQYMQRALVLAQQAEGCTSPNPLVGAVIVNDGVIVGEGYHARAGEPHAEVVALRQAANQAQGATAYVTLEPCSHYGRTPPCAIALIEAGISQLYYAVRDPNPAVSGRGDALLQEAGIIVKHGLCVEEATALNRPFFKHVQTGLPLVTAKFGMSLDGKIATHTGDSQWITNELSRQQGHQLRHNSDAILVGVDTVLADDCRLTTRLSNAAIEPPRHPTRIVLDSTGRTPLSAAIVDSALPGGQTIIATTESSTAVYRQKMQAQGVTVWLLPTDMKTGRVDLLALLRKIGSHDMLTVMVEGGGTLLGALLAQKQLDRIWAFIAPILIGGSAAPTPFGDHGFALLSDAVQLTNLQIKTLEGDCWLTADVRN